MKKTITKTFVVLSLLMAGAADLYAQSAIYACGHIRRTRETAITNLKNSGYTTAILFNVNVENDGSLTTDQLGYADRGRSRRYNMPER